MIQKILLFSLPLLILLFAGCEKEKPVTSADVIVAKPINSCEGCHVNYDVLKAIATPDPPDDGGAGCGGETPHIEPYDRVHLSNSGFEKFKKSVHGNLECTFCHNGVDNTDDKTVAHSGDFISHPSKKAEEKCVGCHPNIVMRAKNSLHQQGWGQKASVTIRSGLASFDQLSEKMKQGYDKNCGKCHASCGDCHVLRPKAGGGGLIDGHSFNKPDMRKTCITCHSSRGGHAFLGVASGTVPDVHFTKAGFTCMSCHTQNEIHGDGKLNAHRYDLGMLPSCKNCHQNITASNKYHVQHSATFNCNTCHSQDYNNCGSCHIGGVGARIPSYQAFKIGINPLPETRPYKYATLRQSVARQDSWINYGTPYLTNFDALPTYKYTTPHNIIRWTKRTKVNAGERCFESCHIIRDGENFKNKEFYLFKSDLEEWEYNASSNIIVDDKLPSSWNLNN
jgi:hypothetical protein